MQRREFITLIGGAAAAWSMEARAQQPDRVRRVGVLMAAAADDPEYQARIVAFLQQLQQLGWVDSSNVRVDTRWATDAGDLRRHAAELAALAPDVIRAVVDALAATGADIATLAAEIDDDAERDNPNVVKPVVAWDVGGERGRALYFTRARAPYGEGALYHHIGIYAFQRAALRKFVALDPSPLERREKLEQLRALEAGMTIAVARVDKVPLSVDTPQDLEKARAWLR